MKILRMLIAWIIWMLPFSVILISLVFPVYKFNLDYLDFLKVIIWPFVILNISFFFRKVFTYLFFSVNGFNFFGVKGNLKNIDEVIIEEANRIVQDKENKESTENEIRKLRAEITEKENGINRVGSSFVKLEQITRESLDGWRKSIEFFNNEIKTYKTENTLFKKIVSNFIDNKQDSPSSTVDN
jgi:hypothetical protein